MDLVADAFRVDHQAGVLSRHDARHADIAGCLVDGDIGDPRRPCRAIARKLAVHIESVGKAASAHDVTLGLFVLAHRPRLPAGALCNCVDEIDGARVLQIAQAVLDRVDAGFIGAFVNPGFMRKSVRQRRDAAQPGGTHDRRHVVGHHAQIVVIVGRDRGAVAHLEDGGRVRDRAGQQQRQRRRAVRWIARGKVIAGDAAVGVQSAIDVHQLRCALWLPRMFLLTRQLNAYWSADGARQQHCVGRNVIGAVAAVATGSLHPDHLDLGFAAMDQPRQFGAQMMRILRAGPDPRQILLIIGNRAGRADRSVHLVRPDVGSRHRLRRAGNRRIDIALVDQSPRRRRIGTQRGLDVLQVGQRRHRLPGNLQLRCGLDRIFLALGDDANEVADLHNGDKSGDVAHGGLVDRDQAVADEITDIDAGIGRTNDAAMQHAGHAHVVNVDQFAGCLRRQIDARHGLADNGVGIDRLHENIIGQFKLDGLTRNQFAIADAAIVLAADQAVLDNESFDRKLQPLRRACDQELPCLRCGLAQRHGSDLDRFARDRRALIGHQRRIAQHDDDARKGDVELFGDNLSERGADAGAEIDMAVIGGDRSVGGDPDEGLELDGFDGGGGTNDGQRSLQTFAILGRVGSRHHACASTARPAARIAARMISTCAPQRQR